MSNGVRKLVLVALTLIVAGALFWENRHAHLAKPVTTNGPAPQFAVTGIDGAAIDSAKLQGKVVLVDFWATWCVPCQSEIPHFVEWQNRFGGDGLQVIGLSMDDTVSPVKAYVQQHKMNYPVAMADEKTIAAFGGVLGLPANILIGRDGRVVAKHVGVTDIKVLEQEVEKAMATK